MSMAKHEGPGIPSPSYQTYFVNGRGIEEIGPAWSFLDITPLGRQEDWQDVPPGRPQGPAYEWWRLHDNYGDAAATRQRSAPI